MCVGWEEEEGQGGGKRCARECERGKREEEKDRKRCVEVCATVEEEWKTIG